MTVRDDLRAAMTKATKAEARYTPHGTPQEHCSICRHFRSGECERVQGRVVPGGWCRFFSRRAG